MVRSQYVLFMLLATSTLGLATRPLPLTSYIANAAGEQLAQQVLATLDTTAAPRGSLLTDPENDFVTIWTNCGFQGIGYDLGVGSHDGKALSGVEVRSVQVPPGLTFVLYENPDLTGASLTVQSDDGCLEWTAVGWHGRVGSAQVINGST